MGLFREKAPTSRTQAYNLYRHTTYPLHPTISLDQPQTIKKGEHISLAQSICKRRNMAVFIADANDRDRRQLIR
jgi:hypothetical protein